MKIQLKLAVLTAALTSTAFAQSAVVRYELTIAEKTISPAGKPVTALMINGSIPGPVLRFRVGDTARIRVHNKLPKEKTLLHWHGLLVPNKEDGVPMLNTPAIPPGGFHDYEFELKHAGTYWYHSHVGLQEQRGVYGGIVVKPLEPDPDEPVVDREHVVLLSDWTNENPNEVMRSLRRSDEWYAIRKGNQQSVLGAHRAGMLGEYLQNQWANMPPMDISDVAYDAFWANGTQRTQLAGAAGERVKLRLINAGAATYFYVHSATGPLRVVAADGMPVHPFERKRLLMGMGETYDVIVTVPKGGRYEIRATAQDGSGHASMFLGVGKQHSVKTIPKPQLYSMDWMLAGLDEEEPGDTEPARPLAPYLALKARTSTAPPAGTPVRELELRLTGDMQRYVWSFNDKTIKEESTIRVTRGEVVRMRFINDTMMHHPLHLHGHFFRLLNGQGDFAPLKHTVDVPPMGKASIEFLANEEGDWVFHCHLLYHMKAGMTRVISYAEQGPDHQPKLNLKHVNPWQFTLDSTLQSNFTEGSAAWFNNKHRVGVDWENSFDEDAYELDLNWKRYINRDWSTVTGYRFTNEHDTRDRAFSGLQHRLPFLTYGEVTLDTEGDVRNGLSRELQLTSRLSWINELEYDTRTEWEWNTGLKYRLNKRWSLTGGLHSDHSFGAGLNFQW
ncbi:multicopper oxidase domain-containing protein [Verrucomicrobia bacterium]|nr:multicopper oxidase domain-containing protein [Verrucomicrobiota bacterium]